MDYTDTNVTSRLKVNDSCLSLNLIATSIYTLKANFRRVYFCTGDEKLHSCMRRFKLQFKMSQ